MSSIENLLDFLRCEFSSLRDITDEWATSSAQSNFTDFPAISSVFKPSFYDEGGVTARLRKLHANLAKFGASCDDPEVWNELTKLDISGRQLCVLLWFSLEWALVKNSSFEMVERGALAASSYLHLSSIKGSKAYHIFHPYLYEKCLQVFRSLYRCLTFDCREAFSKKPARKLKSKKMQRREAMEVDEANEIAEDVAEHFDKDEVRQLFKEASESLFVLLSKISLSCYAEIPYMTTILVRDMARVDCCADTKVDLVEHVRDFNNLRRLSDRSFALMHRLIDSRHTKNGYLVISRIIYPRLAFWTFEYDVIPSSQAIPAMFTTWRDLMVKYIKIRAEIGIPGELYNYFKLIENLYQRCTDRLEYRTRLAQSILNVLLVLPRVYHYEFVQRIEVFSKNQRICVRNFSVEVAPLILQRIDLSYPDPGPLEKPKDCDETVFENDRELNSTTDDSENEVMVDKENNSCGDNEVCDRRSGIDPKTTRVATQRKGKSAASSDQVEKPPRVPPLSALYRCMIRSCLDKSSTVRLRAMYHLAVFIENDHHRELLTQAARRVFEENRKAFVYPRSVCEDANSSDTEEKSIMDDTEIEISNIILHMIVIGAGDDSAGVRKYAVLALKAYFPYVAEVHDAESAIVCLKGSCLDSSLMVRKQAVEVFDYLLSTATKFREVLERGWLDAVLPMINDREQSVQILVAQTVVKALVTPLMSNNDEAAWKMLDTIESDDSYRRLLLCALMQEFRERNLKSDIIHCLDNKLGLYPEHENDIWMLLADLSAFFKVDPNRAVNVWYSLEEGDNSSRVRYVARVLSRTSDDLDLSSKANLRADIERKLFDFRIDAANISAVYLCLAKLMDAVLESGDGKKDLVKFGKKLLSISRYHIRESLLKIEEEYGHTERLKARESLLVRVITTVGEVVQFSPKLASSGIRMLDVLKTILAFDTFNEGDLSVVNSAVPSLRPTPVSSRAPSPTPSAGSVFDDAHGPIIPPHILAQASRDGRTLLTPVVKAHVVLAIGKFCLVDEKIAKSIIPVFVKQLKMNKDHVIRNNIALVVCDLCKRYTLYVDRYSSIIAACLKDTSTIVRQQTLKSLTLLIKEQYVRWEGQIMYRFVSTILDENSEIREYTKFCLRDVLLVQFPDLFSNHFIECLMYFNNLSVSCERQVQELIEDSQRVMLYGPKNEENRMTIYKFMLSTFDDQLKLSLMAHICAQIISPILCGKFKLEDPCVSAVLKDSLTVMCLKEIKLDMDVGKGPDEEEEPPTVAVDTAKQFITEAFCKAMIEHVMPSLLDLRVYLTERRSPLRGPLYGVFRAICREHKDRIDAFLDGDRQLKAEVEYDIRRYELREKAQKALAKKRAEEAAIERRRSRKSLAAMQNLSKQKSDATQQSMDMAEGSQAEVDKAVTSSVTQPSTTAHGGASDAVGCKGAQSASKQKRVDAMCSTPSSASLMQSLIGPKMDPTRRSLEAVAAILHGSFIAAASRNTSNSEAQHMQATGNSPAEQNVCMKNYAEERCYLRVPAAKELNLEQNPDTTQPNSKELASPEGRSPSQQSVPVPQSKFEKNSSTTGSLEASSKADHSSPTGAEGDVSASAKQNPLKKRRRARRNQAVQATDKDQSEISRLNSQVAKKCRIDEISMVTSDISKVSLKVQKPTKQLDEGSEIIAWDGTQDEQSNKIDGNTESTDKTSLDVSERRNFCQNLQASLNYPTRQRATEKVARQIVQESAAVGKPMEIENAPPGFVIFPAPTPCEGDDINVELTTDTDSDSSETEKIPASGRGLVAGEAKQKLHIRRVIEHRSPTLYSVLPSTSTATNVIVPTRACGVECTPSRAFSTPNKTLSNVTFADSNLSAIEDDGKRFSRNKTGRKRTSLHGGIRILREEYK